MVTTRVQKEGGSAIAVAGKFDWPTAGQEIAALLAPGARSAARLQWLCLDYTLGKHGIGHFHETGNVRAANVVDK
jgi:hypothetical protein